MLSTIIFLSSLIIFLSIMLMIDVSIILDVTSNTLKIVIKVYKIKIVTIEVDIIGLFYKINNSKKKKSFNIFITKEQEYLIKQIKQSILDKLYYDSIIFKSDINIADANCTANTIGIINIVCTIIKLVLLSKNPDLSISYSNKSKFVDTTNRFCLDFKVYFTIFDLIFALILSFYKRGKYVKKRKSKI